MRVPGDTKGDGGMSDATTKMSDFELLVLANKRIAELEAKYAQLEGHYERARQNAKDMSEWRWRTRKWARRWKKAAKRKVVRPHGLSCPACPDCGYSILSPLDRFCGGCGAKLDWGWRKI